MFLLGLSPVLFDNPAFSQSGQKWAAGLNATSNGDGLGTSNNMPIAFYTNNTARMWLSAQGWLGLGMPVPSAMLDVAENFRVRSNAIVDSTLNAGSLTVSGLSSLNGQVSIGSNLTIDGTAGTITSTSGNIGFGASDLNTTGDITADTISGNVLNINTISTDNIVTTHITASGQVQAGSLEISGNTQLGNVQADSISTSYLSANNILTSGINANQYLLNGSPLVSSQWTSTGNDIYYNSGNVGIGVTAPSFPFEVHGNSAFTGTVFVDRLAAQTSVTIGQFRFTNGASTPGAADSIRTPARLVVEAQGSISYETDTVRMGNVRFVSTQSGTRVTGEKSLVLETAEELTLRSSAEKVSFDADTVVAKERVGIGRSPEVALDVVGDIRASGSINANSLSISGTTSLTRLVTNRIVPLPGDSIIYFGDSSILIVPDANTIWFTPTSGSFGIQGFNLQAIPEFQSLTISTINDLPFAFGSRSFAIGELVRTGSNADNAIIIGNGINEVSGSTVFSNNIPNSLMIGFNSDKPTLIVGPSSGVGTTGNVGIGTISLPGTVHEGITSKLEIVGADHTAVTVDCPAGSVSSYILAAGGNSMWQLLTRATKGGYRFEIFAAQGGSNLGAKMTILQNGKVGIGTTCPTEKLTVNGKIKARTEVIVEDAGPWCDFVFDPDYRRMSWQEKAAYIDTARHLPSLPPGSRIEAEGLQIGAVIKGVTQEVEESRQDITDIYKRLEELEKSDSEKDEEIKKLETEISRLNQEINKLN